MDLEGTALDVFQWALHNLPGWLFSPLLTAGGAGLTWLAGRLVGLATRLGVWGLGRAGAAAVWGVRQVGDRTGLTAWLYRPSPALQLILSRLSDSEAQLATMQRELGVTPPADRGTDRLADLLNKNRPT